MHEALNKRLAALPDDTVVYVRSKPTQKSVDAHIMIAGT